PSETTRRAFANLWRLQTSDGDQQGSWDWLDFKLEPWETGRARFYGASLAALAIGTAPGYYAPGADPERDKQGKLLVGYLRDRRAEQNPFNRAWLLWASQGLDGLLTADERKAVIGELLDLQQSDGGWRLASLVGTDTRKDGTPQDTTSDGFATGL